MSSVCALCGSDQVGLLYQRDECVRPISARFSPVADDFGIHSNILKCRRCNLVWAEQTRDSAQTQVDYSDSSDTSELYLSQRKERERTFERSWAWINRHFDSPPKRVLDVGASAGIFLNLLKQRGLEVSGVELSRHSTKRAHEEFGLDLFNGSLADAHYPDNHFDLVTMFEVIEHFSNPFRELKEIKRVLRKNGLLLIATPNLGSLSARMMRRNWWSFREMHLFYFSVDSLRAALLADGFEMLDSRAYRKTFKLSYYLSKALGRHVSLPKVFDLSITLPLGDFESLFRKVDR